jgi:16S rRNA (uracil1498-N3)-methyltransferase
MIPSGRITVDLATRDISGVALAVTLSKGERQKWLVEKLTGLGAGKLVPRVTERGLAEPKPSAIERLERGVIEACKQCGRNTLMEIDEPMTVAEVVRGRPVGAIGFAADPGGAPLDTSACSSAAEVISLVGPEGGFCESELACADAAGWGRVALAPNSLRVETAAMAARLNSIPKEMLARTSGASME